MTDVAVARITAKLLHGERGRICLTCLTVFEENFHIINPTFPAYCGKCWGEIYEEFFRSREAWEGFGAWHRRTQIRESW